MAYYYMDMEYKTKDDVPDFGSITMCHVGRQSSGFVIQYKNNVHYAIREYTLLEKDLDKLNLITNAADGSKAMVIDANKIYVLCNGEWFEWKSDNGSGGGSSSGGLNCFLDSSNPENLKFTNNAND